MTAERRGKTRLERVYKDIARRIERMIHSGVYPVATRLPPERVLSEQFGVSRPTMREALIALEVRGLVDIVQGSGVYVASRIATGAMPAQPAGSDTVTNPFEATEARRLLEGEIAFLAATTASQEEINALEKIVAEIGSEELTQEQREQADRLFHLELARTTQNDLLVEMVEKLWDARYVSPLCVYFFSRARNMGSGPPAEEHALIVAALRARDSAKARQLMRDHLARVIESLLAATEADSIERARLKMIERSYDFAKRAGIPISSEAVN